MIDSLVILILVVPGLVLLTIWTIKLKREDPE